MSTDRIKGAAKIIEGAVKEAAGKAVGHERLQAEGAVEKAVGRIKIRGGRLNEHIRNGEGVAVLVGFQSKLEGHQYVHPLFVALPRILYELDRELVSCLVLCVWLVF